MFPLTRRIFRVTKNQTCLKGGSIVANDQETTTTRNWTCPSPASGSSQAETGGLNRNSSGENMALTNTENSFSGIRAQPFLGCCRHDPAPPALGTFY